MFQVPRNTSFDDTGEYVDTWGEFVDLCDTLVPSQGGCHYRSTSMYTTRERGSVVYFYRSGGGLKKKQKMDSSLTQHRTRP